MSSLAEGRIVMLTEDGRLLLDSIVGDMSVVKDVATGELLLMNVAQISNLAEAQRSGPFWGDWQAEGYLPVPKQPPSVETDESFRERALQALERYMPQIGRKVE